MNAPPTCKGSKDSYLRWVGGRLINAKIPVLFKSSAKLSRDRFAKSQAIYGDLASAGASGRSDHGRFGHEA